MNLTYDDVLTAIEEIQYIYRLKYEIRYNHNRKEKDFTESVAEHIFGMHVVAQYFLPLENPDGTWDTNRIFEMITWHDIDEVETGDTVSFFKTDSQADNEDEAAFRVAKKLPTHMQKKVLTCVTEYQAQETIESQFVKAVDKCEPLFHLLNEHGREIMRGLSTKKEDHVRIRAPYVQQFPYIKFFHDVTLEEFTKRGCFSGDE